MFDLLAFSYDRGTVKLSGFAYEPTLKSDAEREAKSVAGVDTVVNNIEQLPVSQLDDQIRWTTFRAIYRSPELSRYGLGLLPPATFGEGPLGDAAIHIIVKNGHVTLIGVVDNEGDRTLAFMKARGVPGLFGVTNELKVRARTS